MTSYHLWVPDIDILGYFRAEELARVPKTQDMESLAMSLAIYNLSLRDRAFKTTK